MNTSEPTPVLLTVKANSGDYTTDSTNGIKYVTLADLGGGGGGSGGDASAANQVIGNESLATIEKAANGIVYNKVWFLTTADFTGATTGDYLTAIKATDNTKLLNTVSYSEWYNLATELPLTVEPTIGTNVIFDDSAALSMTKLATNALQTDLNNLLNSALNYSSYNTNLGNVTTSYIAYLSSHTTLAIQLSGTYDFTAISLEVSQDFGVTWVNIDHTGWSEGMVLSGTGLQFNTSINCGGYTAVRVTTSGWVSGTINLILVASRAIGSAINAELVQSQSVDSTLQETLAIGDTSAHSTSGTGFNKVFLTALDADCWVTFGTSGSDPTATRDSGILIPAGTVYYPIKLTTANRQLAVINNVTGVTGKLNVVWSL